MKSNFTLSRRLPKITSFRGNKPFSRKQMKSSGIVTERSVACRHGSSVFRGNIITQLQHGAEFRSKKKEASSFFGICSTYDLNEY